MTAREWVQERRQSYGRFEVLVDRNTRTEELRVSVYRGETLLANEFIQPLESTIKRMVATAEMRSPQFPEGRT